MTGRTPPDAALRLECGTPDGPLVASPFVDRLPYLQEVTTISAVVMWTSREGSKSGVRLELPDGAVVLERPGDLDQDGEARRGEEPRWAHLDGLTPATLYCVRLVDPAGAPLTERLGFRTAPEAGAGTAVRFIAFGDSGEGGSDQYALLEQIDTVPFDLIVHTGDVAYDTGTLAQLDDNFFGVYQDLLGSIPVFPASGNHDYRTQQAAPFREVFPEARAHGWYSFDWGDVHFVVLDTEQIGDEQAGWLEGNLTDNRLPWTIVVGHRPPYSSGRHGSSQEFRDLFSPILERHHVPLVLNGHDHDYERTTPQNGVTYVVTGGGGRGTYEIGHASDFTAFADAVIHFVAVEIEGDTLTLHAIDATGQEFDSARIERPDQSS